MPMKLRFALLLLCFAVLTPVSSPAARAGAAPGSGPGSGTEPGNIHVFVALCDNVYQRIAPVPLLLGNGMQPETNLYWGAMYGLKTYLRKQNDWVLVKTLKNPEHYILERLVFKHRSRPVYLVADAYAGRYIKEGIRAFLRASAGGGPLEIELDGAVVRAGGAAGLLCFVGHNGLMEFDLQAPAGAGETPRRQAAVFACQSRKYFEPLLRRTGAEALVLTNGNMAPEGYVVHALASAWANGLKAPAVREEVARAYDKYQKCGLKGARRLFAVPGS